MSETHDFLTALWGTKLERGQVQVWHRGDKKTRYYSNLDAAATTASKVVREDVYVAAGLAPGRGASKARASAASIVAIPGVWADIDVNGGPEGKTGAAPDRDAAIDLAGSIIEPTVIVNSGYGIQAWWLFEDPWYFGTEEEQVQAAADVQAFQKALRVKAKGRGFNLDATHDLARLMRLPGTQNCKGLEAGDEPVRVVLLSHEGPRYTIEHVGTLVSDFIEEARKLGRPGSIEIELGDDRVPPYEKLVAIFDVDDEFKAVWDHTADKRKTGNWSGSEYDMSIASSLVAYGWSDQEVADALALHRRRFDAKSDKGRRVDYLQRTISKARASATAEESELARVETVEELVTIGSSGPDDRDPVRTVSLFSKILGGPEVKELVQMGREPTMARFRLVLADGRTVPLGTIDGLMSQAEVRKAYAVVTSYVLSRIKNEKWDKIVQALLSAAVVHQENDRKEWVDGRVESYVDGNLGREKNRSVEACDPYEEEGMLLLHAGAFTRWLKKTQGERLDESDVRQLLDTSGFERKTVSYRKRDGRNSTRSYYRIEKDAII